MSVVLEFIRLAKGTKFAARVEIFSLKVFGKEVARYSVRDAPGAVTRAAERELKKALELVAAGILEASAELYEAMLVKYPRLLVGMDKATFAEMVALAVERGRMSPQSLRGLLVEKLCRTLPDTRELLGAMDAVQKAANKGLAKGARWGRPRFAYSIVDKAGKQLADLSIICEGPNGRVWIMAVIESKSASNVDDLVKLHGKNVGQHLWNYTRAKSGGVVIDGEFIKPSKLEFTPVPVGKWGERAGAVAKKDAAARVKEMSGGLYTQFIGFVPQELSPYRALQLAEDGIQVELWRWPFDLDEFDRFQKELVGALGRTRKLLP